MLHWGPQSIQSHPLHIKLWNKFHHGMLLFRLFDTLVSGDPIAVFSLPDVAISQEPLGWLLKRRKEFSVYIEPFVDCAL